MIRCGRFCTLPFEANNKEQYVGLQSHWLTKHASPNLKPSSIAFLFTHHTWIHKNRPSVSRDPSFQIVFERHTASTCHSRVMTHNLTRVQLLSAQQLS